MRNFKKVLALVLVMSMLLSFATMVSAADFTDMQDVEYKEAVDVIAAIGVINGNSDGSFDPAGDVTRAEMATMITFLLNKGDDVGDQFAAANIFTDCTNHWAKGYIGYAASLDIIAGVGDGTFDPDGPVTGVAAMKMALVAMGYDAEYERWAAKGPGWANEVLSDALFAGLTRNFSPATDFFAPMTREQAAQLLLNALEGDMVYYNTNGAQIPTQGGYVLLNPERDILPSTGDVDDSYVKNSDKYTQLVERYFPDLKYAGSGANDFGQDIVTWTYENKKIGDYVQTADYTFVVDERVVNDSDDPEAIQDKIEDLSGLDYKVDADTIYLNKLQEGNESELGEEFDLYAYENGADYAGLHEGDIVELYVDEDDVDEINRIVVHRYEMGKIVEVDTDVTSDDAADGVTSYIEIEDASGHSIGTFNNTDIPGYHANYVAGTALALQINYEEDDDVVIANSYIAETVEGEITARKEDDTVTIGGEKYSLITDYDNSGVATNNIDFDEEYIVYLTNEGYAMAIEGVESTTNVDDVYYVTGVIAMQRGMGLDFIAQAVDLSDGTVEEIQLERDSFEALVALDHPAYNGEDDDFFPVGGLYEFTDTDDHGGKKNDDLMDAVEFEDNADFDTSGSVFLAEDLSSSDSTIYTDKAKGTDKDDQGVEKYYINDDTQFVAIEGNANGIEVEVKTGSMKMQDDTDTFVIFEKGGNANVAKIVVFADADELNTSVADSDDVLFLAELNDETGDDIREAVMYTGSGEQINGDVEADGIEPGKFYTFDINDDDVYELDSYEHDDKNGDLEDGALFGTIGTMNGTKSISFEDSSNTDASNDFEIADNVVVRDLRDDDVAKKDNVRNIRNINDLEDAVEQATVQINALIVDETIIFIGIGNGEDDDTDKDALVNKTVINSASDGDWDIDVDTDTDNNTGTITFEGGDDTLEIKNDTISGVSFDIPGSYTMEIAPESGELQTGAKITISSSKNTDDAETVYTVTVNP